MAGAGGLFVGLDVGTQGVKAVVYDSRSRSVVSRGAFQYDILKSEVPGRAEQPASLWIEGGTAAMKSALASVDRKNVRGVGISGQQHGFVPLDKDGKVIRHPKLWCDVEASKEADSLSRQFNFTVPAGFTGPKIAWLQANEPDNYARLRHVLLPHDYYNYHLSGEYAMECGDASGTGLFDTAGRKFDKGRMDKIDSSLHSYFPPLLSPDQVLGELRREVAEELGLGAGVGVAPGSGDNMMSALGAGAVQEGKWVISLGTSGTLFGATGQPVLDPSGQVAPFCDATGQWLPLLCTMNCTTITEEVRKAFGMDHETITRLAEAEPPGCHGLNLLPYITGERTPNWPGASGALTGLRPGMLARPGLIYRAALEAATFCLLYGIQLMRGYGLRTDELRVVGGGSKNRLWRRIIADSFQLPLRFPTEPESAALGAALQAAAVHEGASVREYVAENEPPLADETMEPNLKYADAYGEAFERHQSLGHALFDQ